MASSTAAPAAPGCHSRAEQWVAMQSRTRCQLSGLTIPAPRACKLMKHRILPGTLSWLQPQILAQPIHQSLVPLSDALDLSVE